MTNMKKQMTVGCGLFLIGIIITCGFYASIMKENAIVTNIGSTNQRLIAMPRVSNAPVNSNQSGDEWPMFRGSLNHTGVVNTTPVQGTGPSWNYTIDTTPSHMIYPSPTVANGLVYVGSEDKNVYCLNSITGTKVWNYSTAGAITSSPTIAAGCIYVGSHDSKVYCLNAETGSKIWNYTIPNYGLGNGWVTDSPCISNGRVYVGCSDSRIYCLNASQGTLLWSNTTKSIYEIDSSPAIVNNRIYFGSGDGNVFCWNATTGVRIWNYTTGNWIFSSPTLANGHVYIGSMDSKVYCLDATTGARIWNYTAGGSIKSSPAYANGCVFIGSDDHNLYCLNANTGAKLWNFTTRFDRAASFSPAYSGDYVYTSDGIVLYCLNASAGAIYWSYTQIDGYGGMGEPILSNGHVFVEGSDFSTSSALYTYSLYCMPMIMITPPAPQDFKATGGDNQVILTWQPSNGEYNITNYKIYYRMEPDSYEPNNYVIIGNTTTYTYNAQINGHVMDFEISAINGAGEGAKSEQVSVTPNKASTPGYSIFILNGCLFMGCIFIITAMKRKLRLANA